MWNTIRTGEELQVGLSVLSENMVQELKQNLTLNLVTNHIILAVIYEAFFIFKMVEPITYLSNSSFGENCRNLAMSAKIRTHFR